MAAGQHGNNCMKIVDSFLFSETFEKELLLLKFILEDTLVDEWILLENAYSFQGDYKGLQAAQLIDSDDRFIPFKNKVTIISKEMQPELLNKEHVLDEKAFKVEHWQRDLAHQYFVDKYSDEDWIIISDVDEALDATDANRKSELLNRIRTNKEGVLHVATKRYWFDFDNEYKIVYGIPMCTKAYLIKNNLQLHDVRVAYHGNLQMKWNNIIGFEYSSCFNAEEIFQKLNTNAHTGYTYSELQQALRCNHRPISSKRSVQLTPNDHNFFELTALNESNSPKYVRENIDWLKTNNIHPNYKENRQADYPHLFSATYKFKENLSSGAGFIQKKLRFLLRRLKLEKLIYG